MDSWILVFVGFSIISTIKELMYSREGRGEISLFYGIISFIFMFAATYISWNN